MVVCVAEVGVMSVRVASRVRKNVVLMLAFCCRDMAGVGVLMDLS